MTEEFIKKIAQLRADEIFTAEYYTKVTDSWFLDELFEFESKRFGVESRKPTQKESDIYMGYMFEFFNEYKEKLYSGPLAQDCYSQCIDCFDKLLKLIEYGNIHHKEFHIDDETIKEIKHIGNIFVNKHNSFCNKS